MQFKRSKRIKCPLFIYTARSRTYVLNGPGAIVKKITFKKSIDFCGKIIIIISVKGKEVEWTEDGSENFFSEKKKFPLDNIREI